MFSPQEFWSVVEGLKPVARKGFEENIKETEAFSEFKEISERENLQIQIREMESKGPKASEKFIYLSNSAEKIDRAYNTEVNGNVEDFGKVLGYPDCCIEKFEEMQNEKKEVNRIKYIYENSEEFFFENNNLFSFPTRINYEINEEQREVFYKIDLLNYFLIFHIPCSYDCKKSRNFGKKVLKILKEREGEFGKRVEKILRRPILFFDDFNWIVFKGKAKNGQEVVYESLSEPKSLYPVEDFKKGNRLRFSGNEIKILKNEKLKKKINTEKKPILLTFNKLED